MPLPIVTLAQTDLPTPLFLPDATLGVVRAVDAADLQTVGIQALVMNTFHLMQRPGSSTITALGGIHKMSGWRGPIVTDSGGFQAYSLIRQNPRFGSMNERGISFQPEGSQRKFQLTPEKSVQLQIAYGTDVVICLDDCTHVDASYAEQRISVERTVEWARRGQREYDRLITGKKLDEAARPRLFAVIQGGGYPDLRRQCAESLLAIGFDGYGYGGWPLDNSGALLTEMIALTRELIPAHIPMHALGVGHPENVLACYRLGYELFDSAMPTRDARHGRLYAFTQPADAPLAGLSGKWLAYLYINDEKHIKADLPVSPYCDCPVCARFSLGYLHHLFKIGDTLFFRLATLHNLRFMTQLTQRIREADSSAIEQRI
jgi:queuine tRNA-ribosyltransferase